MTKGTRLIDKRTNEQVTLVEIVTTPNNTIYTTKSDCGKFRRYYAAKFALTFGRVIESQPLPSNVIKVDFVARKRVA